MSTGSECKIRRTYENDLRLVQFLLHAHDRVCLARVLVLGDIRLELGEADRGGIGEGGLRDLGWD